MKIPTDPYSIIIFIIVTLLFLFFLNGIFNEPDNTMPDKYYEDKYYNEGLQYNKSTDKFESIHN